MAAGRHLIPALIASLTLTLTGIPAAAASAGTEVADHLELAGGPHRHATATTFPVPQEAFYGEATAGTRFSDGTSCVTFHRIVATGPSETGTGYDFRLVRVGATWPAVPECVRAATLDGVEGSKDSGFEWSRSDDCVTETFSTIPRYAGGHATRLEHHLTDTCANRSELTLGLVHFTDPVPVGVAGHAAASASGEASASTLAVSALGDAECDGNWLSGRCVAASGTGDARACSEEQSCFALSGTGDATSCEGRGSGCSATSGTGNADACRGGAGSYLCLAASGTGDAVSCAETAHALACAAVSGTGTAAACEDDSFEPAIPCVTVAATGSGTRSNSADAEDAGARRCDMTGLQVEAAAECRFVYSGGSIQAVGVLAGGCPSVAVRRADTGAVLAYSSQDASCLFGPNNAQGFLVAEVADTEVLPPAGIELICELSILNHRGIAIGTAGCGS